MIHSRQLRDSPSEHRKWLQETQHGTNGRRHALQIHTTPTCWPLSHPAQLSPYPEDARICVNQYAEQQGGALAISILKHSALNQRCAPFGPRPFRN